MKRIPIQNLTRWALNAATHISDRLCQRALENSARRLGNDLHLPKHFIQLLLAIEDKRFAYHPGIDLLAIFRAFIFNFGIRPNRSHGASTITQQVYSSTARKNREYSPTLRFKLLQATWAIQSTTAKSKQAILSDYLDSVYFGKSYYGIEQAASGYFSCSSQNLTIAQSFFLVERIARPNTVSIARVRLLVARISIFTLFNSDPKVLYELPTLYERHFHCGEAIAICLEKFRRKQGGHMCTFSAAVSSAQ